MNWIAIMVWFVTYGMNVWSCNLRNKCEVLQIIEWIYGNATKNRIYEMDTWNCNYGMYVWYCNYVLNEWKWIHGIAN